MFRFQNPIKQSVFVLPIIAIGVIVYYNALFGKFINLDDHLYLTSNNYVKNFGLQSLKKFFFGFTAGHYHPITMLSFSFEYFIAKENPLIYHISSLLIHILNAILVLKLCTKLLRDEKVSFIIAIIFTIHPLCVESVAWIACRGSLLYPFFYLSSLIFYVKYVEEGCKTKDFVLVVLFFLLSLFSKSSAITLPVVLLCIDYYLKGKINRKAIIEKIPLLLLSFAFGALALIAAKELGSIGVDENVKNLNILERGLNLTYAFSFYIIMALFPSHLLMMHFRAEKIDNLLPLEYYLSPLVIVLIIILFIVLKRHRLHRNYILGLAFYLITISPFLQFIPVGGTIASERYAYLPLIGLLILFASVFKYFLSLINKKVTQYIVVLFLGTVVISFSIVSIDRTFDWQDSMSLYNDFIEKEPESPYGWECRGGLKQEEKDYTGALSDYKIAIDNTTKQNDLLLKRGNLYNIMGNYQLAISDFNRVLDNINEDSDYFEALLGRGISNYRIHKYGSCVDDISLSLNYIEKDTSAIPYFFKGSANAINGNYKEAISDYTKAISFQSDSLYILHYNRGNAFMRIGETNSAIEDYKSATKYKPDFADAYNNIGVAFEIVKAYEDAINSYKSMLQLNPNDGRAYYGIGNSNFNLGKPKEACSSWKKAIELGHKNADEYFRLYCD